MNHANPPAPRRPVLLVLGRLERDVPRPGRTIVRERLNWLALCPACGRYHLRPFRYDDIEDLTRVDLVPPDPSSPCPISRARANPALDRPWNSTTSISWPTTRPARRSGTCRPRQPARRPAGASP